MQMCKINICATYYYNIRSLTLGSPVLCMIRERHTILKAALHTKLAVLLQLATYPVLPIQYIVRIF